MNQAALQNSFQNRYRSALSKKRASLPPELRPGAQEVLLRQMLAELAEADRHEARRALIIRLTSLQRRRLQAVRLLVEKRDALRLKEVRRCLTE